MKIELTQTEMPLLSLTKVQGKITFKGKTPSYEELKTELVKQVKAQPDLILIKHIYTNLKSETANFTANIYKDAKTLKKFLSPKEIELMKKAEEEAAKKRKEEAEAKKAASAQPETQGE